MIIPVLFVMSLFMLMDLHSFNKAFDYIVPLYSIAALAAVAYFFKTKKEESLSVDVDDRKYVFQKKGKRENLTWKQKFFGEFVKYDRVGLADFLVFNGAPGFIARSMAGADMTQWVEHPPGDESCVRLRSKGVPAVDGFFTKVFDNKEEADKNEFTEYTDKGGKMKIKLYWKEEEKKLILEIIDPKGFVGYQERCLTPDDDHLHHFARMTNLKGENCEFQTFMKRV